jgi:transposase
MGITKRGDRHLRTLLVHGARAVLRTARNRTDRLSEWANLVHARRGANKAIVAVANKNARVIWAVLRRGES